MRKYVAVAMMFALALIPSMGLAQTPVGSNTATVGLAYAIGESITVSATPATTVFTGTPATTGSIAVTTSWVLSSIRTHLDTNLYFSTATAALTDGVGDNIPSSEVFANMNGGAYSACNKNPAVDITGAVAGATCNVGFGVAISSTNLTGSNTTNFTLQLQGLSGSLPAGTYTGTLNIVAGAD